MKKEIKVRLYADENDDFVELWKVIEHIKGEPQYYGRYTYGDEGTWYYVCDPLGYCELDRPVSNDIIFVLCDDKGNEYTRYSNGQKNTLLKFETYMKQQWQKVKHNINHNIENLTADFWAEAWNGETTMKINQWLLSYKDPTLYKREIEDMHGYDENWTGCWHEHQIEWETIPNSEFYYLGKKYQFTKVKHKHDICGVEWYEFVCTDSPISFSDWADKDRPWINSYGYMGNWFDDSTYGTMYDKRTAREKVVAALQKAYPPKEKYSKLLVIRLGNKEDLYSADYCYERNYSDTADYLINNDLHRKHIDYLCKFIRKETKDIVFPSNRGNKVMIKKKYPEIYGYDYCLL